MSSLPFSRTLPLQLGPYQLTECLGQGGFAPVWRAQEVYDGRKLRDVAVKLFFLPDNIRAGSAEAAKWRDGVLDEASALCRVEHSNIVRFLALHQNDAHGVVGLVMEYVAGKNLGDILQATGPLETAKVIEIGISISWALAAVHNAGLVHRDVKPENIIETNAGYKLVDFGIVAQTVDESRGNIPSPALIGTPGFIPPEYLGYRLVLESCDSSVPRQTQPAVERSALPSPSGDIFALGVTLHLLATNKMPDFANVSSSDESSPEPTRRALLAIIAQLLAINPTERPQYADWIARELESLRGAASSPFHVSGRFSIPIDERRSAPGSGQSVDSASTPVASARKSNRDTFAFDATLCEPNLRPPLMGRADALSVLDRAIADVHEGHLRVVLMTGPLGVGRTRLMEEAITRSGVAKNRVLRMHSSPERQGPLKPLLASLRAMSRDGAFRGLEEATEQVLRSTAMPSTQQREVALEAIEDALLDAAMHETIVLAADDIQWADESTLRLLKLLVERADREGDAKLLVLVTARDEPRASAPLCAFVGMLKGRARRSTKHITLGSLAPDDAKALAQGVCPLNPSVERVLVRDSGGVPFFLVNALLSWRETRAIIWYGGAYHAASPELLNEGIAGVAALLDARLTSYFSTEGSQLRSAQRTLAAVALYGGGLPTETLFDAFGDDEALEDVLETLVGAGILSISGEMDEYGFAQEMVRQAALNLVRQKPWFRRVYRALLDAVARRPSAAEEAGFLATGYEKLGDRQEARTWLARAMDVSIRAGLFTDAQAFGDRLGALATDVAGRADVELAIVRALVQGRQFHEAKARLERIAAAGLIALPTEPGGMTPRDLKWRILRLEVARGCSEVCPDTTIVRDADVLNDKAIACEARMALAGVTRAEEAAALVTEAVELAEQCDSTLEFRARVLRFELTFASSRRDLQQAEQDLRRALAIARSAGSVWQEVHIEGDIAALETETGRTDLAIERYRRLADQAEAQRMTGQRRMLLNNLAACLMREGRAAEAADVARQTADVAKSAGDWMLLGLSLSLRAYALFCIGDLNAALASANGAESVQRDREDGARALTLLRRALILDAMGNVDDAWTDVQTAAVHAQQHGETVLYRTAILWEKLFSARRDPSQADTLREALAAMSTVRVGQRSLTRRLVDQATAWLESQTE